MFIERWITSKKISDKAVYFRKTFSTKNCKKAILKISALGWVKIFINGQEVGKEEFLPGWTDYTKRVLLFSYDITHLLLKNNAIGAVVGKGWAMGTTQFGKMKEYYRVPTPCLFVELEWMDEQGNVFKESENGWKFGYGTIIENDIMLGETQDYFQNCEGFSSFDFDDKKWEDVCFFHRYVEVEEQNLPRVFPQERFNGLNIGNGIYDFRQNFSGVVELIVKSKEKAVITIQHAEILDRSGDVYIDNLREAKATDKYIIKKGTYVLRPWFTYHGFRYAKIIVKGEVEILSCVGLAIYSNAPVVGAFSCSSSLVNQIVSNCLWSLKSNLHYVPTDCPQRDERLGWLGDAGVIARTIMYNFNSKVLWKHYLSTIAETVREDGAIACIAPNAGNFLEETIGASGWADAFISILADYYDFYADKETIERYFSIAERFIDWIDCNSQNYRRNTYCFSDWLSINANYKEGYGDVDFTVFDLCWYAMDCLLMERFCLLLNKDASIYQKRYKKAKNYFLQNLYKNGEIIGGGQQTALLLAYKAKLLSKEQIEKPLIEDISTNGMTCGFIGTKYLLPTLTELGYVDLAYSLIANTAFPSWGHCIKNGATTIWERWDSYTKERGINKHGMNSFNHFAFASCMEWFYGYVLGIQPVEAGFSTIRIIPYIDRSGCLTAAQGSYETELGKVSVSWETDGKTARLSIEVPVGITYMLEVPNAEIVENDGNTYIYRL